MFSNGPKTLLYSQNGKAQISISSVSQTKELITDTRNRDQVFLATPLGLFSNFPRPLSIVFALKPMKLAKWNYGGYCCLPIISVGKT